MAFAQRDADPASAASEADEGPRPANTALWLAAKGAAPGLGPAPYTRPAGHEIVVRNRAVAINPVDWLTLSIGGFVYPWLEYPFILGSDVAGEVVEVGGEVARFRTGDRVVGHAVGAHKSRNRAAEGGFQTYTVLLDHMAAPIPDAMAFETAAVLPLGLSTAACALFETDQLALAHPSPRPRPTGKTLLVWGGSTSVGANAIQLARAAGYEVIATASPRNFAHVEGLGASAVFDRRGETVVADIIAAFDGRVSAGALAIGHGSTRACLDILRRCAGDRVVAMATPPVSLDAAPTGRGRMPWLVPTMARLMAANASLMLKSRMGGIRTKFIFGTSLVDNEVGEMIWADFLPAALAEGRHVAAPDPLVVGHGLERIVAAIEMHKQGVSARKLVVTL